ncbi:MAG: hypothetical protein PWQ25_539 [Deferribacteres bacterium]|jgi:hypothetical protein|nr:hypothetical protein [Deferribacteraceae bacterium]MDK2791676.1 hypothetical protein [Deferribacteres bacterium]
MVNKKFIYASGFGDLEFDIIKQMAQDKGYPTPIQIFEEHLDNIVENLKTISVNKGTTARVRIILFENMDSKTVISFINDFKSLNLPPAIFAMVTEHSRQWTFRQLASHLIKEHKEMAQKKKNA